MSLPTRGAWIEIGTAVQGKIAGRGGRSPHGERGLKYLYLRIVTTRLTSLPTRGAWIEMASTNSPFLSI